MEKHQNPKSSQVTLTKEMRGQELGEEGKVWQEVAASEARITLMKTMIKQDLAFADLEEFGIEFNNKMKSNKSKNTTIQKKVG